MTELRIEDVSERWRKEFINAKAGFSFKGYYVKELIEEIARLTAQLEALSKPVTDEEWSGIGLLTGMTSIWTREQVDAIIAARRNKRKESK